MRSQVILDIGCGNKKVPNSIGIDKFRLSSVDLIHDLENFPYPLKDNYADLIYARHFLEHTNNPIKILNELWRIGKPNGKIIITVPHYSGVSAWIDITHKRCFSYNTFDNLLHKREYYLGKAKFKILRKKLKWSYLISNPIEPFEKSKTNLLVKAIPALIQLLINIAPSFCERYWGYWVGGLREVYVELEVVK